MNKIKYLFGYYYKGDIIKMIELTKDEMHCLRQFYNENLDVVILSCIEGNMGEAWVDDKTEPTRAIVIVADFCYLFGAVDDNEDDINMKRLLDKALRKIIVIFHNSWIALIEKHYVNRFKKFKRFSIKREPYVFQRNILSSYIKAVESNFEIKRIDEDIYYKALNDAFMADCCSNFSSIDSFLNYGVGYVIMCDNEIISGASSYSYCKGSIEITIGTKEEYRRKGLALACASKLILECLDNNIYPRWDAVNMESVALAEKLGYHFDKEYEVYTIR